MCQHESGGRALHCCGVQAAARRYSACAESPGIVSVTICYTLLQPRKAFLLQSGYS